jgi:hypothetical protein
MGDGEKSQHRGKIRIDRECTSKQIARFNVAPAVWSDACSRPRMTTSNSDIGPRPRV